MFSVKESWGMTEPEKVLAIVKELGIWRLGNCDGCMCSSFSLRDVNVDIACGKGRDRGIYIHSNSMEYHDAPWADHDAMLRPIAEEVQKQVESSDGRGPAPIYFHPWRKMD